MAKKNFQKREAETRNVSYSIEGTKLTFEVDLAEGGELSSTKRSMILGSTGGYVNIEEIEGMYVNLMVGVRIPKEQREGAKAPTETTEAREVPVEVVAQAAKNGKATVSQLRPKA